MPDDNSDKESVKTEEFAIRFEATMEPGGMDKQGPELMPDPGKEDEKPSLDTPVSNFLSQLNSVESKMQVSTLSACVKDKLNDLNRLRISSHMSNGTVFTPSPITLTTMTKVAERSNSAQTIHPGTGTPGDSSRWFLGRWRTDLTSPAVSVRPTQLGTPSTLALGSEAKETFRSAGRFAKFESGTSKLINWCPAKRLLPTSWRITGPGRTTGEQRRLFHPLPRTAPPPVPHAAGDHERGQNCTKLCFDDVNPTDRSFSAKEWDVGGLSEDEINALVAERDELYEILRMNEDADSARFASTQALINFKQDAFNEQQRLRQRISALEEELELSMCRLNQLNVEQNELKEQLQAVQGDRESLEHQLRSARQKHEREMAAIKEEYMEREKHCMESMRSKIAKQESRCTGFLAKEAEMNQTIENLRQQISDMESELMRVQTEKSNLISEQSQKEALWNENMENMIRKKLTDKEEEFNQLNEKHFQQMTELTDRLVGDSRESINEIRSCYLERIEELQKALEQRGSVCAETHNELRGLEQKLDELLSRDTTDERQQAMYNALMTKLSEMRLPNSYKCCSTSGETAESIDRLVSLLRQELQQERERSNAEKIEAEKLRRNFEDYRADTDRRFLTCSLEIERIKINHEAEMFRIQTANEEKLNQLTAKNTKELIEERQRLNLEQEERLRAERNSVGEAFEKAIHCTSQILAEMIQEAIGTMNNWSSSLHDDPSHMNGANNERFAPPEKESVDTNFGLNDSLTDNSLIKAFCAQLLLVSRERSRQLLSALNRTLTDTQQRLDDLRHQFERERRDAQETICQLEHKAQLSLEKAEQRHIIDFQKKMQQLGDKSTEAHLLAQLKQKEDEITELRTQIESLETQLKEKAKTALRLEYERQWESKLLETAKLHPNPECVSGSTATRVVIELKNRIQRLREENLSLRRLLLRRLPSRNYTTCPENEENKTKNRTED